MALLNLSLVTSCYTTLLQQRIPQYRDWPAATPVQVSAGAPDIFSATNGLSFYLYHVREDAHTKSQDWQVTNDAVPQRFKPMGVTSSTLPDRVTCSVPVSSERSPTVRTSGVPYRVLIAACIARSVRWMTRACPCVSVSSIP